MSLRRWIIAVFTGFSFRPAPSILTATLLCCYTGDRPVRFKSPAAVSLTSPSIPEQCAVLPTTRLFGIIAGCFGTASVGATPATLASGLKMRCANAIRKHRCSSWKRNRTRYGWAEPPGWPCSWQRSTASGWHLSPGMPLVAQDKNINLREVPDSIAINLETGTPQHKVRVSWVLRQVRGSITIRSGL